MHRLLRSGRRCLYRDKGWLHAQIIESLKNSDVSKTARPAAAKREPYAFAHIEWLRVLAYRAIPDH